VSTPKRTISVIRSYSPEPSNCEAAVALLLNKPKSKKGTQPGAPDDAKVRSDGDSRARQILPK
jgi:hypothetical protein